MNFVEVLVPKPRPVHIQLAFSPHPTGASAAVGTVGTFLCLSTCRIKSLISRVTRGLFLGKKISRVNHHVASREDVLAY